jgi:hypothetical protein
MLVCCTRLENVQQPNSKQLQHAPALPPCCQSRSPGRPSQAPTPGAAH